MYELVEPIQEILLEVLEDKYYHQSTETEYDPEMEALEITYYFAIYSEYRKEYPTAAYTMYFYVCVKQNKNFTDRPIEVWFDTEDGKHQWKSDDKELFNKLIQTEEDVKNLITLSGYKE